MEKLGFSLQSSYGIPMPQVIDMLADTGFRAISPVWQRGGNLSEIQQRAQARNLTIQSLHGPLRGLSAMWQHDPEIARPILEDLLQSATDCAAAEIPILIVHSWTGLNYTFRKEDLCFDYFDKLVRQAQRDGICIAFENLEGPEYLEALMERYEGCPAVGFCWDSGHEQCYSHSKDLLALYGDRLIATHLNDNLGVSRYDGQTYWTDDLHLLPFDGVIDWTDAADRLKNAVTTDTLPLNSTQRANQQNVKTANTKKWILETTLQKPMQELVV